MNSGLWYYMQPSGPEGPVSWKRLEVLVKAGILGEQDLVRRENDADWLSFADAMPVASSVNVGKASPHILADDAHFRHDQPIRERPWSLALRVAVIVVPAAVLAFGYHAYPDFDLQQSSAFAIIVGTIILVLFYAVHWELFEILQDWEVGSRIEGDSGQLVWWSGPHPATRHAVRLDTIRSILLKPGTDTDGSHIALVDNEGRATTIDARCVKDPAAWSAALNRRYPHITVIGASERSG
jgi:hypothetical protein